MILINTNKPRNSKKTIEAVMKLKEDNFEVFESLMDKIS